ncbi:MAG: tetratricopeptide repeat protein, partial [Planctomycetota bacterium JB042]
AEEGLAEHRHRRHRLDEAEALLADGLDAIRTADARARRWNSLAVLYGAQGRLSEAEACAGRSVEAARVRHGEGSEPVRIARDNHASLLARLGRHEEALAIHADTLPAWRRALRDRPAGLVQPLNLQANCLAFMGRWAEAEPLYREAVDLSRAALEDGAPLGAASISGLGVCLARLGRLDEAESLLQEAEAIWTALGDAYDDRRAGVRRELERIAPAR